MKISDYINQQIEFSKKAFGSGARTEGLCRHIESELDEIRSSPHDIMEWMDVIILGLDGAWRAGFSAKEIEQALIEKQIININRKWPAPRSQDEPIEHTKES